MKTVFWRLATLAAGLSLASQLLAASTPAQPESGASVTPAHAATASAPPQSDRFHKKVAILVFDGVDPIDFIGPMEVFGYSADIDDVYTVAATPGVITATGGMKVMPTYSFADAPEADIVVIPGGDVDAAQKTPGIIQWVQRENNHAEIMMSVCNGAFILASTGLLDGLHATTTAYWIPALRARFPKITVVRDQRVVDNGRLITTGGLTAGMDGAFHVLARMFGDGHAQQDALVLEYNRAANLAFAPATLAYNSLPNSMSMSDELGKLGTWDLVSTAGTTDHWEVVKRLTSDLPEQTVTDALSKAYAGGGSHAPPNATNVRTSSGERESWKFQDSDNRTWAATLVIQTLPKPSSTYLVKLEITRAS